MSEVNIHIPSFNEINQARWNIDCTTHLNRWFDSWVGGWVNASTDLIEDPVKMTVLYFADKDGNPVDIRGDLMNIGPWDDILNLNPLSEILHFYPIPFVIRPPEEQYETGYLKEKRYINGEAYSFYSPISPGQTLKEGQEVVHRKVANPQFPYQTYNGNFQTKF